MSDLDAELSHSITVLHSLTCEIVQAIQILLVAADYHVSHCVLYLDYGLEHHTASLLDELAHRVKVCGVGNACRENALSVLTFALSIELFPPLCEINEFRRICYENLHCLVIFAVKQVSHSGILDGRVLLSPFEKSLSLLRCTLEHGADVESCEHDRQKSYRSKHAETSAYVIRNHESPVSFLSGKSLESALMSVGHSHDAAACLCLSVCLFDVLLYDSECNCRLRGGSRFGNHYASCVTYRCQVHKLRDVILAEVISGENYLGNSFRTHETVAKGLYGAACTQIRAAYAYYYYELHAL